ncbi:acyl-CoA dehydrogenase family protein [Nocardia sp. NPDC052278]|uniref:acyl-CoA dehydrogenase family protein n=1 Tax=unclassified Nocardia TaxID=2637762 RepID=UPI00367F233F
MFDERWPDDAEELAAALASLLDKHCPREVVRSAEDTNGNDSGLDTALNDFGLWELGSDPYLLTRAAVVIGSYLAPVPFVAAAPAIAVLSRTDTANGIDRDLVPPLPAVVVAHDDGVALTSAALPPRRTSGGEYVVDLRELQTEDAEVVADTLALAAMRSLGLLLEAARLVGAGETLLRDCVRYVSERHQFGQPIGAFQGVSHPLAEVATALQAADLLVRKAAFLADPNYGGTGTPPMHAAAMAAHKARSASRLAATVGHQVLGGYGFTLEADCQLYSRRIRAWSTMMPDPSAALADLARTLADPTHRETVRDLWQFDHGFTLPGWAAEIDKTGPQPNRPR